MLGQVARHSRQQRVRADRLPLGCWQTGTKHLLVTTSRPERVTVQPVFVAFPRPDINSVQSF